jgi:hypothetical protein
MSLSETKGEWMMNSVTSKFLPALVALTAMFVAGYAQAATITVSYVNGQVSTVSNFTTATTSAVNLASTVTLAAGQYFRFGVAISVSGNPNPEFGSAYAADANAAYGVNYANANMGFANVGVNVLSSDTAGTNIAPLVNGTKTRVGFNTTIFSGATVDNGDVTGGVAGSPSSIFKGLGPFDPTSALAVTGLATLATPGANYINTLPYLASATASGAITLTPSLKLSDTNIWKETVAGADDGGGGIANDAVFLATPLGGNDSVVYSTNGGHINISFGAQTPEPASIGLIGLSLVGLLARRRTA